jgi:hypothetical protein
VICPYSFDEPVGSGIPALLDGRYWCMGHIALGMSARRRRCPEDCPVCLGEWGAWRSILWTFDYHRINIESARLCCCAYCTGEPCPMGGDCDNPEIDYAIENAQEDCNAVGWLP